MVREVEAKFLGIDPITFKSLLIDNRYRQVQPRYLMRRVTLHRIKNGINAAPGEWYRIREEGPDRITMTYKKTIQDSIDGTEEIEVMVSHFDDAVLLLEKAGLSRIAYQETYREVWIKDNIEIVIDEWPGLRPFVEIEGANISSVTNAATTLGFDMASAVFGSVGNVYKIEMGITPDIVNGLPRITFDSPPIKRTV